MRLYFVLVFLFAALVVVNAGNPDCQRNGEMTARLTEETKHIMSDSYQRGGRGRRVSKSAPTPTQKPKPSTPVILAKDYTQLPATFDGYTGPHGESRIYGRNFTSRAGIKSRTCQIDCKSTVEGNKRLFSNCRRRFYSYGTESKYGCLGTAAMMQRQAQIVLDVCHHYNKCRINFTPKSLLKTMRHSKGINTIASQTMSSFARELEKMEREAQDKAKALLKQGPDALKKASPAVRYEMRAILEQDRAKAVAAAMKSGNYNLARAIKSGASNVGMEYANGARSSGAKVGKQPASKTKNTISSGVSKTSPKGIFSSFFSSSRSSSPRSSSSKISAGSSAGSSRRSTGSKNSSSGSSSTGKSFSRSSSPSSSGKSSSHSSSASKSNSSSNKSSSSGSSGKSSGSSGSSSKSSGSSGSSSKSGGSSSGSSGGSSKRA